MVFSLVLTFVVFLLFAPQFFLFTLCFTPKRHVSLLYVLHLRDMFHRAWLLHWFSLFLQCILLLQHLFLFLFYLLYFHIHFLFSYFLYSTSFILLFLCSNYNSHIFFFINPYCFLSLFHISEVSYFFSYCICISFCCNVIHKDG